MFEVTGFSFIGSDESVGMFFIRLKDYERSQGHGGGVHRSWAFGMAHEPERDGIALFFVNLPTIPGLGNFGGFDFWLEDRKAAGRPALYGAHGTRWCRSAAQEPGRAGRAPNELAAVAAV